MDTKPLNEKSDPPVRIKPVQAVPAMVKPVVKPVIKAGANTDARLQPAPGIKPERIGGVTAPREPAGAQAMGLKPRHALVLGSFLAVVLAPLTIVASYLFFVAADQYHSTAAFSIRSEESNSAVSGLLGALTQVSSGSASDPDILFEYIRSQEIVEELDAEIGLSAIYRRAPDDWFFSLNEDSTIEDLLAQWDSMVHVTYESSNGILQIQTEAFTPDDAHLIAEAILQKSSLLVNKLSETARADAIRFASEELAEAEANLHDVRRRLTEFRRANRIVDPRADAQGQLGILTALQTELARALIERDSLTVNVQANDPRVTNLDTRIDSINKRIEAERHDLSGSAASATVDIFGEYEDFLVQQEFANAAYTQALAGLSAARAEARRQARYIAIHVEPTLAQTSLYPRSLLLTALTALFCLLGWAVVMLVYYNVRDNR